MNKTFSAEYDFSCVRQIARADRFARVLTHACAIARVKRNGLVHVLACFMEIVFDTILSKIRLNELQNDKRTTTELYYYNIVSFIYYFIAGVRGDRITLSI